MASFRDLAIKSESRESWFDDEEIDEDRLRELVKRGLEIRPDRSDGLSFWDDFLTLFGQNSAQAAELFGVRQEAISRATNRVRKIQKEVREDNDLSDKKKNSTKNMMHTGVKI